MPRATPDGMKVCSKCRENKPVGEFYRDSRASDDLQSACKVCKNLELKAYYEANSDKVKAKSAKWAAANSDKVKAKRAAWREANRDKTRAASAKWAAANSDKVKAKRAAWVAANRDKWKATNAAWRAANKNKWKVTYAAWKAANPLCDSIVKRYLNLKDAPPELIELKRLQVQIKRELKRQEQSK